MTYEASWQTPGGEAAWAEAIADAHRLDNSSDASLAHFISFRADGLLLFDHAEGSWYGRQSSGMWRKLGPEFELQVLQGAARDAMQLMRGSNDIERARHLATMASNRKAAAVAKALSVHEHISARGDQWDRDPWLLGTASGVVDLRTGHEAEDVSHAYVRRRTTVPFIHWERADREDGLPANAPRRFIAATQRILPDPEVWRYVMRALGYALTGVTSEQVWYFLHGKGANGKTFLIELLRLILGDAANGGYAYEAKAETFTASKTYNPLNFGSAMNAMRGARLVIVPEISHGELNTDLLKQLSGGEPVTYRAPYAKADVSYTPSAKLVMYGNARPTITDSSHGQWRRLLEIPFDVTIPPEDRVKDYHDVLYREEGAAIQRLLIDAAGQYARLGLLPVPAAIRAATDAYQASSDPFSIWLGESCVLETRASAKASELFRSYDWWCSEHHVRPMNGNLFYSRLGQLAGVERRARKDGNYYLGVALSADEAA